MNPLIRRRLPPSVRSLLTDIGPKEEWNDTEADPVSRDGVLLPSRAAACQEEEFLTPAKTRNEESTKDGSSDRGTAVCMLCKSKPSCYTCPRCNLHYCGLACYRSPDHSACSEEFYKESVLQELKNMGKTESEGKKKMQEILMGLRQKAECKEGGMESLLKEVGIVSDDADIGKQVATEEVQVVELLSRLAEIQQSGEGSEAEIVDILKKLEEIDGGELSGIDTTENLEEEVDLADRLSGLVIDELSEEELWELLNSKEKETFLGLMKSGSLGKLVPAWKPWWEEHEEGGGSLVEELSEEMGKLDTENVKALVQDHKVKTSPIQKQGKTHLNLSNTQETSNSSSSKVPPISAKIPKLTSLCANPSVLVCYSLVNALFGYTFTLSLLNGDTDSLMFEFCDMILALSEALNSSRVFSSIKDALESGESLVLGGGYFDKEDPLASDRAVEAVAHIMTGRDRKDATGYCLAALSQLRSVLSKARTALSKEGQEGTRRRNYFLASKKCEFFQAWVMDNAQQIRKVALELWNEYSRKESVRKSIKEAKTAVEKVLEKRKGDNTLIEELS
ncbi:zinc finger HIT domain-containing protein 2 [Betta splendens]|uniref:Zinc finger HIT domain-containing protein 2 n=1 Tax=Betta splendens TaxID=158456 RepID=A0A6P7PEN1_BETSP|nr:zinc finger HIT domain-containing protein 2 [Betta splendens]XP_029030665.1 zinc finger HIT domain-containing protein 2 [Betta splendens]XP_029030666.1 zinc finger HIT domain-containing protein 2 [Betta splendens]